MAQSPADQRTTRQRASARGLSSVSLARAGCDEHFVTVPLLDGERPESVFERAAQALADTDAVVVSMAVAGDESWRGPLRNVFGTITWPVTWIAKGPARELGGIHIWAVGGPVTTPLERDGAVVAVRFEDAGAAYCRGGGFLPQNAGAARGAQATELFHAMENTLRAADMEFSDTVRTWFYNRDITAWYKEFNLARDRFLEARGLLQTRVPASTGIGADTPGGAAITGGFLAIRPTQNICIAPVSSPMQCAATDYGSAFSRAIEIVSPDHTRLLVSGTASICPHGQTLAVGDVSAQTFRTVEVVGALLGARGTSWDDVTNGIAYIKDPADAPAVRRQIRLKGLEHVPILMVHADICRDDLLFELEVCAISTRAPEDPGPGDVPGG